MVDCCLGFIDQKAQVFPSRNSSTKSISWLYIGSVSFLCWDSSVKPFKVLICTAAASLIGILQKTSFWSSSLQDCSQRQYGWNCMLIIPPTLFQLTLYFHMPSCTCQGMLHIFFVSRCKNTSLVSWNTVYDVMERQKNPSSCSHLQSYAISIVSMSNFRRVNFLAFPLYTCLYPVSTF